MKVLTIMQAIVWSLLPVIPGSGRADSPQVTEQNVETAAQAITGGKPSFVILPVPQSSPSLGNGLSLAGVALYEPDNAGGVWSTGIQALYTDTKSWGVGIFHKAHFADDRVRSMSAIGHADLNLDFYGIGADAGGRDFSIPISQKGTFAFIEGLYRLSPHIHVGPRYRFLSVKTAFDLPVPPAFSDMELPPLELESQVSGLGIASQFDSRNSEYSPSNGMFATASLLWNDQSVGSDFDYSKFDLAVNAYHKLGPGVLAMRGSMCLSSDGAPFYDLCSYGQANDLRGYAAGRYRDHSMAAVQAEYRFPLFWRLGAVAFAGTGAVAPDIGDLGGAELLPAAGVGLRFAASRKYNINLSFDAAWGDGSSATYFYIGEAF